MKLIKKILNKLKFPIDIFFSFLLIPASIVMGLYRKFGSHKLPLSKKILNYFGIFPLTNHYYEPLFDFRHLKKNLYEDRTDYYDFGDNKFPYFKGNSDKQLDTVNGYESAESNNEDVNAETIESDLNNE